MATKRKKSLKAKRRGKKCRYGFKKGKASCLKHKRRRK